MPLGLRPRKPCTRWGSKSPMGRDNFEGGKGRPTVKYRDTAVTCAKTAEPIDLPFGLWTQVGWRKHNFNCIRQVAPCGHIGATWRIRLNRPSVAAMRSYVKLLWPLVFGVVRYWQLMVFKIQVCFSATVSHPSSCWALAFFLWLWPMTLTFKCDHNTVHNCVTASQ